MSCIEEKLISFVKHSMFCQIFCHSMGCVGVFGANCFFVFCVLFVFVLCLVSNVTGTVYEGFDNREIMYVEGFRFFIFSLIGYWK